MQFQRPIACAAAFACFLAACGDQSPVEVVTPGDSNLAASVEALGFRADHLRDLGEYVLVEGDILVEKQALTRGPASSRMAGPTGPRGQYSTNYMVGQARMALGLKVDLSHISGAWLTAAREAIKEYNWTLGTKIYFVESSTAADITVRYTPDFVVDGYAGAAWPTSGGHPGATIWIYTYTANNYNAAQKKWIMVHQLGHTIGYRHADTKVLQENASPGQNFIPGTTLYDYGSVMWLGSSPQSWNGFSTFDRVANQVRYPAGTVAITSQGYDAAGHPTFTWSNAAAPEVNLYRIFYHYTAEYWEYDPSYPEGGYYTTAPYSVDLGTTTATTFTDASVVSTGNSDCGASYSIQPYYPSGKGIDRASTMVFDVC